MEWIWGEIISHVILQGMGMEDSFPTFGNAEKVTERYHFISFPMFVLSRNGKQSLYNFSIIPILNQIKKEYI